MSTAHRHRALFFACAGSLLAASAHAAAGPELWFYNQTNLQVQANVDATKALLDRAAAAGYSHMMLADTKLAYDGGSYWSDSLHRPKLQSVLSYASSKGIKVVPATFDLGRADNWLLSMVDQNLAEGQQVLGANFTVAADGRSLLFNPQNPALTNTSFTAGNTGWARDPRASIDATTGRTDSASLKVSAGGGRGWAIQTIDVQPNRQYHVSYWARTQNLGGELLAKVYDPAQGRFRESHEGNPALSKTSTQAWKKYDYVFNSASSSRVELRLGSWGSTTGNMWFDDVSVQETTLHNVVTSAGSPVTVTKGAATLAAGSDYNAIQEPFVPGGGMTFKLYEAPLSVTLPTGSTLQPGDAVKINYDAAQGVYQDQYGASLTEQGVKDYYARNVEQLRKSFADGTGFMLGGFDELRHGASSTGAKATGKTGGQLLAEHFQAAYDIARAEDPTAPIYTWNDMFDPYHNARDKFYLWDSTIEGSWNGLPDDVTIFNWLLTAQSLQFFSGRGNDQILAGYYDRPDGYLQAWNDLSVAIADGALIPGVRGLMYTTWDGNYAELEDYARGAQEAWAAQVPEPAALAPLAGAVLLLRRKH